MITVKVQNQSLEVKGHAEMAPYGQDIVCAGVSAITLTLVRGLIEIAHMPLEGNVGDGCVRVRWKEINEIGRALIDTWYLGMCAIADEYENCIKFL